MKEVIILRHSNRGADGLLSEVGKAACQQLQPKLGSFDVVIASPVERTQQTATLLTGKDAKVDSRAFDLNLSEQQRQALVTAERAAGTPLEIVQRIWNIPGIVDNLQAAGTSLAVLVKETLTHTPTEGRALIISHNLIIIAMEKVMNGQNLSVVDQNVEPLDGYVYDHTGLRAFGHNQLL